MKIGSLLFCLSPGIKQTAIIIAKRNGPVWGLEYSILWEDGTKENYMVDDLSRMFEVVS